MFDADRFYMTSPIGNIGIKMFGRKQPFRVHSSKLVKTRTNLIKPRRITTSRENSVNTPPIAEVIPLY
jgi:hypothetical protein